MLNRENLLESVRGYYYADTKELIAVDRVEMRNDEYELKGDSVVYNMATAMPTAVPTTRPIRSTS